MHAKLASTKLLCSAALEQCSIVMGAAVQKADVPLKVIQRIRDFLSLANNNPNQNESARARERATELLQRHGLTESDLVLAAVESLFLHDGLDGNQRVELSRVVARSRGVTPTVDSTGNAFTFKGYPEAAKDARELFAALVRIVESGGSETNVYDGQGESSRFLWRTCFWLGFVEAIQKQLDPEHGSVPKEALAGILQRAQTPSIITKAARAFENLSQQNGFDQAERFKSFAHNNGYNLGMQIQVPSYRGKK